MKITRRQFIAGTALGSLVAALSGTATGSAIAGPAPFIAATVRRHFGDYRITEWAIRTFATDYAATLEGRRRLKYALLATPQIVPGLRHLSPGPVTRRLEAAEREIVTAFVLATNISAPGFSRETPVVYAGYDPLRVCNPFASRRSAG